MKICHVVSSLDPASGGPFSVVTGLAAAQAALEHEVWIMSNPHVLRELDLAPWLRGVSGFDKVTIVPNIHANSVSRIIQMRPARPLRRIVSDCDIVHLHGVWDAILLTAATFARKVGTIYVVTPHGMLDPWSLRQKRWKKKLALRLGFRKMLGVAAFLHVLNTDEEEHVKALLTRGCQTVIIPNGIPPADIAGLPPKGTFYNLHPELNSNPYILFLGRLHFKKGLDYLVDAFFQVTQEHANVDLVIAGPDSGERNNLLRQVEQLRLGNRVHMVGPLYGHAKFAALMDATIFCLPSRQEGFSMSIIEALACGLPVVISPQCHFNEVSEIGAGEVVILNPKAIADAIARFLGDKDLRRRAGEAGRALVLNRFTWPKIAIQTTNAYARALRSEYV